MAFNLKRAAALGLTGLMALGTVLTGCGSSSGDSSSEGSSTSYTYMISNGVGTTFIDTYADSPAVKYWTDMFDIDIETWEPVSGAESDYINTLMATGEYPDVMCIAYSSETAYDLYEEGIALDITDYVNEYMPNYLALVDELDLYDQVTTNIDGEQRYIQLYDINDAIPNMWGGYEYRRDWIVKYGTNPETGEAFTSGWDGDEYYDDVVFPSGNTDPYYISDWEWMFEIFTRAMDDLGVSDGYCLSIPYAGFSGTNDFASGFGSGAVWYIDEDGVCQFGGNKDAFRVSTECYATWYKKGWIDQSFEERSGDIFFQIDTASVYSGKVGMWYGLSSQLGNAMDTGDALTDGIMVFGAPQPINDVYGDEQYQMCTPTAYYAASLINVATIVTSKAEDKDLATLFTALDYLYSVDGGFLRSYGFSDELQAEVQDPIYAEYLPDGAYTVDTDEDGNTVYRLNPEREAIADLSSSIAAFRITGRTSVQNVNAGNPDYYQHNIDLWTIYNTTGTIPSSATTALSSEASAENSQIFTDVYSNYMAIEVARFVTGERDITDDADWQDYCDGCEELNAQKYADNINEVLK